MCLPAHGRAFKAGLLQPQERVWWFDGDHWMVGRVDVPTGDAYWVHFPNGRTQAVPASELRVRWSVPLEDPLDLLKAGTVETRFFHTHRTNFLRSVAAQRAASLGLGGLLSSAIEIHEHQVGAARRVLSDPIPRYLLADEVGLGKTIEAGMILRQLLLDSQGVVAVVVPDTLVGQWTHELETKFRIRDLPGSVTVVGHTAVEGMSPQARQLVIVDEAHRFTDQVTYGGRHARDKRFEALRQIAHSSHALLLLSATPVRTNEDAFLGLLHLLDPENYHLSDVAAFRRRVEMRDSLATAMSALSDETPLRYLGEPLSELAHLVGTDPVVAREVAGAQACIAVKDAPEARAHVDRLRNHVSETYRLHRRLIRNRRVATAKRDFPVRGRKLSTAWLIVDPDRRRQDLFDALENLRLDLPAGLEAAWMLQAVLGRLLAPAEALLDLSLALQGKTGHDLSDAEAAAITYLVATGPGLEFARQLDRIVAKPADKDRLSALLAWARQRVGRGKFAVACSFPHTARRAADLLTAELGRHRVTALLEDQRNDERTRLAAEFASSAERNVLVLDRSAEEGTNLQNVAEVLHLNMPTWTAQLEQRLGRFDRWSESQGPVRSVAFTENFPACAADFGAWTAMLNDVFRVFTASTSTLQYVLADLEQEFFRTAVTDTLADAKRAMADRAEWLEVQRRRIAAQDSLDSIEDRHDDEELARRLVAVDESSREIDEAVDGYVKEMLNFSVTYGEHNKRFSINKTHPPLLTEATIKAMGPRIFDRPYTTDRVAAAKGWGLLRCGEPFVEAFTRIAEVDDRGKAFAVEVQLPRADPEPMWIAFCFDFAVGPTVVKTGDDAFDRAVAARSAAFLPTSIERVWWMAGRGECPPKLVHMLERKWSGNGTNLGSRPERFREIRHSLAWTDECEDAYGRALGWIRRRETLVQRVADAKRRMSDAYEREIAVISARAAQGAKSDAESRVAEAVALAIDEPRFSLESCGVVFVTWNHES